LFDPVSSFWLLTAGVLRRLLIGAMRRDFRSCFQKLFGRHPNQRTAFTKTELLLLLPLIVEGFGHKWLRPYMERWQGLEPPYLCSLKIR
jgi:hypothetical protein